jgi:hypothetical protein
MRKESLELISTLERIEFMRHVGEPVSEVVCLPSWESVASEHNKRRRLALADHIAQLIKSAVSAADNQRFQQWNEVVRTVIPVSQTDDSFSFRLPGIRSALALF